jgi:hypothetical protein
MRGYCEAAGGNPGKNPVISNIKSVEKKHVCYIISQGNKEVIMKKIIALVILALFAGGFAVYGAEEKKATQESLMKMLTYAQVDIWGNVEIHQFDGTVKYKAGGRELEELLSGVPSAKKYIEDARSSFIWGWVFHLISTGFFVTDVVWYVADADSALKQPWLFYGSLLGSASFGITGSAWLLDGVNKYYLAINEYNKSLLPGAQASVSGKEIRVSANFKF